MEENFPPLPDQENERIPVIIDEGTKECVVWSTQRPSRARRQKMSNVIFNKSRVNPSCRNVITSSDAWRLFFTAELIYTIAISTNECIRKRLGKCSETQKARWNASFIKETNATKIEAFFELCYIRGLLKLTFHRVQHPSLRQCRV